MKIFIFDCEVQYPPPPPPPAIKLLPLHHICPPAPLPPHRSIMYYPSVNWQEIWANRPTHMNGESEDQTTQNGTEPMDMFESNSGSGGGSVAFRGKRKAATIHGPHTTNRTSYHEAMRLDEVNTHTHTLSLSLSLSLSPHTHTHTHTNTNTCIHICSIRPPLIWGLTHTYTCMPVNSHTHTHSLSLSLSLSLSHTHTHTHTHTQTHTHTHTHTRTLSLSLSVCLSVCLSVSVSLPLTHTHTHTQAHTHTQTQTHVYTYTLSDHLSFGDLHIHTHAC